MNEHNLLRRSRRETLTPYDSICRYVTKAEAFAHTYTHIILIIYVCVDNMLFLLHAVNTFHDYALFAGVVNSLEVGHLFCIFVHHRWLSLPMGVLPLITKPWHTHKWQLNITLDRALHSTPFRSHIPLITFHYHIFWWSEKHTRITH